MSNTEFSTMKAVGLKSYLSISDDNSLIDITLAIPTPEAHDLLVQVEAISVNPVDTKIRKSKKPSEDTYRVIGWDAAGEVIAVGNAVTLFKPGDAVYYSGDVMRPGCNSQFQIVDERIVGRKPVCLTNEEAAALPLTGVTASEGLFERLKISAKNSDGKTLLIIGASGGVGSVAIQLAKQINGLTIVATASRPESVEWCKSLGADRVINHHEDLVGQLRQDIQFVDYIFCLNSTAHYWPAMCELIAPQGTICSIVEPEATLDLNLLKSKSATFVWEFMFTRSMYKTTDMIEQHNILNQIADLVDEKRIKTTLSKVIRPINAKNLRAAHAEIETGKTIGKIVLAGW